VIWYLVKYRDFTLKYTCALSGGFFHIFSAMLHGHGQACVHSNERLVSIKDEEFLHWLCEK
jgi:hypothetical protein